MKSKLLYEEGGLRRFAVVFDKGDDVRNTLLEFANANRFGDAQLTAIGALARLPWGISIGKVRITRKFHSASKSRCSRSPATLL